MLAFRFFFSVLAATSLSACHFSYLVKSGYHQAELLARRVSIEKALESSELSPDEKHKLRLSQDALQFAKNHLGLKVGDSYRSYVKLDRNYVTWAVTAAEQRQLKAHLFHYPIVGSLPYKGFFSKEEAEQEAKSLEAQNLDTYVRGVSAYSTLGWFNDPLLSSMLRYEDPDLVNLLIHESVHATLFIKGAGDFNERLATFLGNAGTEEFYLAKEGKDSETLQKIRSSNQDDRLFSQFLSTELKDLELFYASQSGGLTESKRQERLQLIRKHFESNLMPKLKTRDHSNFGKPTLNNAYLVGAKTYLADLSDFEKAFEMMGRDFRKFLDWCRELENSKEPEKELRRKIETP